MEIIDLNFHLNPPGVIELTLIRGCPQTYMDRQPGLGGPGPWFLSVFNF